MRSTWLPALLVATLAGYGIGCGGNTPATPSSPSVLFSFPILERDLIDTPVMGFDHDPEEQEGAYQVVCSNYAGEPFPHCYDGHLGSDFLLSGGFDTMEAGSAAVIAAVDGEVVEVVDGNYDQCHGDLATLDVDCDGHPMVSNTVVLAHDGGVLVTYAHFMAYSIGVEVGDTVAQGDVLGLVGSSGRSSQPHLHFEIEDASGTSFDPFAGEFSQEASWWCDQGHLDGLPEECE